MPNVLAETRTVCQFPMRHYMAPSLVSTTHLWNKISFIKQCLVGWYSLMHIYFLGSARKSLLRNTWAPLHILPYMTPTNQLSSTFVKYSLPQFLWEKLLFADFSCFIENLNSIEVSFFLRQLTSHFWKEVFLKVQNCK